MALHVKNTEALRVELNAMEIAALFCQLSPEEMVSFFTSLSKAKNLFFLNPIGQLNSVADSEYMNEAAAKIMEEIGKCARKRSPEIEFEEIKP